MEERRLVRDIKSNVLLSHDWPITESELARSTFINQNFSYSRVFYHWVSGKASGTDQEDWETKRLDKWLAREGWSSSWLNDDGELIVDSDTIARGSHERVLSHVVRLRAGWELGTPSVIRTAAGRSWRLSSWWSFPFPSLIRPEMFAANNATKGRWMCRVKGYLSNDADVWFCGVPSTSWSRAE